MATHLNRDSTLIWRKSGVSGGSGECVEVARAELYVLVRDSRDRSGVMLQIGPDQWRGFIGRIKNDDTTPG